MTQKNRGARAAMFNRQDRKGNTILESEHHEGLAKGILGLNDAETNGTGLRRLCGPCRTVVDFLPRPYERVK
jgi:hypothetical protein